MSVLLLSLLTPISMMVKVSTLKIIKMIMKVIIIIRTIMTVIMITTTKAIIITILLTMAITNKNNNHSNVFTLMSSATESGVRATLFSPKKNTIIQNIINK
jgi:hypothetical protein